MDKKTVIGIFAVILLLCVAVDAYLIGDLTETPLNNNLEGLVLETVSECEDGNVCVVLFWGEGCPHCTTEKIFLGKLKETYPEIQVIDYEVFDCEDNFDVFEECTSTFDYPSQVPITVVGNWSMMGYDSDAIEGARVEAEVRKALGLDADEISEFVVELPGIGIVDTRDMGVLASTIIIGFLDGFNPCAFFVLMMLLTFLIYAKSRGKMLVVGFTFVFVSALVYFMAMALIYMGLDYASELITTEWLLMIGGAIALVVGFINIKDFFFFKKGVSLTISEDKKPKLYKRMRSLLKSQSMIELVGATIILALVANSYELVCTAAMPLVYNNLLLAQGFGMMEALMYIALYCAIYILPLLTIVLLFVWKFNREKMSEESGQTLKAISGIMMIGFGLLLILAPNALSSITTMIGVMLFAIGVGLGLSFSKKIRELGQKMLIVAFVCLLFAQIGLGMILTPQTSSDMIYLLWITSNSLVLAIIATKLASRLDIRDNKDEKENDQLTKGP